MVLILGGALALYYFPGAEEKKNPLVNNPSQSAVYESRTNSEGQVSVAVTPKNLAMNASVWEFEIVLDTHSVELDYDLAKNSALVDSSGNKHSPFDWEGDPPGGHHRKGVLKFRPVASRVRIGERGDEIGQLATAFNLMAGSIQSSHEELIKLSTIDGLTGLYNHREFQKRLEEEVNRAYRYGSTLSLLMMDIDNFKKFNDTYGHQAGDTVLKAIGTIILQEIRKSDFAARYGGEEISIILPETASAEAFAFSDRLREIIHNLPITIREKEVVYISVSIGIASFPEDAANRRDLIDAADKALYFAKDKGRNKTIVYSESLRVPPEKEPTEVEEVL